MVLRRTGYKIAVLFLLLPLPSMAGAAEREPINPLVIKAKYEVAWSGIPIGRIYLTVTEDTTHYRLTVDTKTSGIARIFSDEKTLASAEGTVAADGSYLPAHYESRPQKSGKGAVTTLTYDAAGKLKERSRVPDDDPHWRPPVPFATANLATDSVTAGLVLRKKLYNAFAAGGRDVSVKTYDGARLAEMHFVVTDPAAQVEVLDKPQTAIVTAVTRQPIAGYTPKELKKYAAGDPPIHLYFSADAAMAPVKATVETSFGELTATLVERE